MAIKIKDNSGKEVTVSGFGVSTATTSLTEAELTALELLAEHGERLRRLELDAIEEETQ